MSEDDKALWKTVTDTVVPLGNPGSKKKPLRVFPITEPSILDLHGLTVQEAYDITMAFLGTTTHESVTIITGRSGIIRAEFERWVENLKVVRSTTSVNDGAFLVRLR